MVAVDVARSELILNAELPVGTGGKPGTQLTALSSSGAMYLLLTSTASTQSAAGTQLTNGTGYTTNGLLFSNPCSTASGGPPPQVTMPATAAMSWTSSGSNFETIVSLEIQDYAQTRGFYGNWNGEPISVANGNTFQVAVAAIVATGF
jgi:hypothetical protein